MIIIVMFIHKQFYIPIGVKFFDLDVKKIESYTLDLMKKQQGVLKSNQGGWQSEELQGEIPELNDLFIAVEESINEFHSEMKMKANLKQKISNCWLNVNGKGNGNKPHRHFGSVFSGVFYIKCNRENGNIVFVNPNELLDYHWDEKIIEERFEPTSGLYEQWPEENKLLIFPSHVNHWVEPNQSDELRISFAFNTEVYDPEKING